ncbi:MAG: hypothetical protein Q8O76_09550, partial [Chloroflexota bacterium]|nr:hypothetical protein [Chloroflexota bacterium]
MRAQITLTPTESKKLIAKAIARMEPVARAARQGMVVLHPSSSTYFVAEELTGKPPQTKVWVLGLIAPKGACIELENDRALAALPRLAPHDFAGSWVVKGGVLTTGQTLSQLFAQMGPKDVYIKG